MGDDDSGPEDALDDLDLECVACVRLRLVTEYMPKSPPLLKLVAERIEARLVAFYCFEYADDFDSPDNHRENNEPLVADRHNNGGGSHANAIRS